MPAPASPEVDSTDNLSAAVPAKVPSSTRPEPQADLFLTPPLAETADPLCLTSKGAIAIRSASIGELAEATGRPAMFYGWLMLPLAMLVMIATCPGQTIGVTFFIPHLRRALALSQTEISATYLLATLLASLPLTYLGALADRLGLKRSLLIAVSLLAATCVAASQVRNAPTLLVVFLLLRLIGPGTMSLLANNTLAMWFDRRLGMASGFLQLGMAGAIATFPTGILLLIDAYGWRAAYALMGFLLLATLLPLVLLFYRQRPSDVGQWPDGIPPDPNSNARTTDLYVAGFDLSAAIRHRSYWILLTATAVWALIGTGIVFHIESLFLQGGFSQRDSAHACTLLAMGMGMMQLAGGLLADRLAIRWLVAVAMSGMGASCLGLALAGGRWIPADGLFVATGMYGMAQGLMTIVVSTVWARYYGRAHLGKIRGTTITAAVAGSSVGPLVMGISVDNLGGFAPALWLFAAMALLCGVAGLWATPPRGVC